MPGIVSHATVTLSNTSGVDRIDAAVEACKESIALAGSGYLPYALWFVSDAIDTAGSTAAAVVHGRLGLPEFAGAYDMCGGPRSTVGALKIASTSTMLAVVIEAGGASAFCFGKAEPNTHEVGGANVTDAADTSGVASVMAALESAMKAAECAVDDLSMLLVSGHDAPALADSLALEPSRMLVGSNTAQLLADGRSLLEPGSLFAQVVGCDGVDVRIWRR